MKKIISLLTAAALIFTLASCSGKPEDESGSESESINETAWESGENNTPAEDDSRSESNSKPTSPQDTPPSTEAPSASEANTVRVTLTEGMTLVKMSWLLEDKGVCSSKALIDAAQNGDFSAYSLAAAGKRVPNLCFPLEGYLAPNTYEFYKNEAPENVLKKLIAANESRITADMRARASELGYSMHEILTLASIIEKEAQNPEDRAMVSSVLHNRLNKGMKLECDVTINYVEYVIKEIYPQDDNFKYYYSTKRCKALPAGPICNPGTAAIKAALYPKQTDYLFFVMKNGQTLYAVDYATHQENCKKLGVSWD